MVTLSRRHFLQLSAVAAGAAALASCGPKAAPTPAAEKEAETKAPPTSAPAAQGKTPVVFLCAGTSEVESKHQKYWTEEFNKATADVEAKIELIGWSDLGTKQRAYIAAGDAFEVSWYCGGGAKEAWLMDWVAPLDEGLGDLKDTFKPFLFDPMSPNVVEKDGKKYWIGLPFCNYAIGVVARKDRIIEKAGLADNKAIQEAMATYDGFLAVAQKIHNPPDFYAVSGPYDFWPSEILLQNGLFSVADFSPDWQDKYIAALEYVVKLNELMPKDSVTWVHRDDVTAYSNGTVGLNRQGTYFYGDVIPRSPDLMTAEKCIVLPEPHGPGVKDNLVGIGFCGYWMCSKSKHKDAAVKFMRWLAKPEVENTFPMNLSPLKGVDAKMQVKELDKLFPGMYGERAIWWFDGWNEMLDKHTPWWGDVVVPSAEITKIFSDEMVRLFNKETTPQKAYDAMKPAIEAICKSCPRQDGKKFQ